MKQRKMRIQNVPFGRVFISPDDCNSVPSVIPFPPLGEGCSEDDNDVMVKRVQADGTYKLRGRWHRIPWGTIVEVTSEIAKPQRI